MCFWQVKTFTCAWLWSKWHAQRWDYLTTHLPAFSSNSLERKWKTRRGKEKRCWPWWLKEFLLDKLQDKLQDYKDKILLSGILAKNKISYRKAFFKNKTPKKGTNPWKCVCVFMCVYVWFHSVSWIFNVIIKLWSLMTFKICLGWGMSEKLSRIEAALIMWYIGLI